MRNTTFIPVSLLLLAACQQQEPAVSPAPPPPEPPPASAPAAGPIAAAPAPAPLPPAAPAERVQSFQACWTAFNAKDWPKFAACYAEGATREQVDSGFSVFNGRTEITERSAKGLVAGLPDIKGESQLTLLNGGHLVSVVLLQGTHTGPLPAPDGSTIAATNRKIGLLSAQAVDLTEDGRAVQAERLYTDGSSELGQLGLNPLPHRKLIETSWSEKPVVLAANSDIEKANLASAAQAFELFNKHDAKGLNALLADDVVWSEASAPADRVGKAAVRRVHEEFFKAFPDLKLEVSRTWAAGDYVVSEGTLVGTNTGNLPSMKLKKTGKPVRARFLKIDKLEGGKLKNSWIFDNGLSFASQLGLVKTPSVPAAKSDPAAAAPTSTAKPGAAATAPAPAAKPAVATAAAPAPAAMSPASPAKPGAAPAPAPAPAMTSSSKP